MLKAELISWATQLGIFAIKQLMKYIEDTKKQEALMAKAHAMNQQRMKAYQDAAAAANQKADMYIEKARNATDELG